MRSLSIATICLGLFWWAASSVAGERASASVQCQPTDQHLVYVCDIRLVGRKSKKPLAGAELTVKADMPSMPMAHNVRPANATPTADAGVYTVELELEMHGEWALTLDVSGPTRDRVIRKLEFLPK
ncbi:MAG: hypothetical protein GKR94_05735 [Gammaproteobacteria bacterium]|nr:hypothetical protein [Gammaproteobacteria bacterium]